MERKDTWIVLTYGEVWVVYDQIYVNEDHRFHNAEIRNDSELREC